MTTDLGILASYGLFALALTALAGALPLRRPVGPAPAGPGPLRQAQRAALTWLGLYAPAVLINAAQDSFTGWTLLAGQLFLAAQLAQAGLALARLPRGAALAGLVSAALTGFLYIQALP